MKRFDAELLKQTLMRTPWDSVFIFDETDDVLDSWEKLFIDGLEQHWRTKRVAWVNQAPWITPAIIKQLQFKDALLKSLGVIAIRVFGLIIKRQETKQWAC